MSSETEPILNHREEMLWAIDVSSLLEQSINTLRLIWEIVNDDKDVFLDMHVSTAEM